MTDVAVQKEPDKKTNLAEPAGKASTFSEVIFNEDITILPNSRLAQYDKGPVKAYAAMGSGNVPASLIAMICEEHFTPRSHQASNYASIANPALLRLIGYGPVEWAPSNKQKYCLVYENSLGQPLMADDTRGGMGLRQDVVLNNIIRPIVNAMVDMRDRDLVHGCIRVSNIFDGGGKTLERAVLGECLSMPTSSYMPALYETIERSLANPTGRGSGKQSDDLYSFGVCLAIMLRGVDPLDGMTDSEIIDLKMEEGSYVALTGKDRFTGAILELLRGLLYDDENQRWTLDEVVEWLDGRRLSPKQAVRRIKASRPIIFNGEKYIRPEMLAKDLNRNPTEARQLIENGEMEQWLERAMENKVAVARYDKALQFAEEGGKGSGYTERLVTRVAMALHPEGPIRYKSINVMPDGVGTALTEAFVMKRDLQTYTEFFMNYFITQWVDVQPHAIPDVSSLVGRFDSARAFLRQKGVGGGLERCIYALDTEVHCLSEKLAKYHVRTPEELLRTYEIMARNPGRPGMFFDRHIIAFLLVKDRKNIDPHVADLNSEEPYRRALAEAKVLATIQKRSQMENFPGIAGWMLENLEPVYERFHDRELRAEIRKKADKLKENGDLARLINLFDTPVIYQEDNVGFRRAMRKYYELEEEFNKIETDLKQERIFGIDVGRQIAAMVAAAIAALIILVTAFSAMSGGTSGQPF